MELWFNELHTPNMRLGFRIKRELEHVRSKYQDIYVFETYDYGNLLVIDGTVQTTERDEYIYHEMIVHMPMLTHGNAKKVLVIGGGDGGAAKEALKHNVDEIHVVEIDEKVVDMSKKYLPTLSIAYSDSHVHLHTADGTEFVKSNGGFDVIIVDSTDPVGPALGLFKHDFYESIKKALNPGGVLAQQCGTPFYHPEQMCTAKKELMQLFAHVKPYLAYIPTYPAGMWAFIMASDSEIKRRKNANFKTMYYTDDIYSSSMVIPQFVDEYCENQRE